MDSDPVLQAEREKVERLAREQADAIAAHLGSPIASALKPIARQIADQLVTDLRADALGTLTLDRLRDMEERLNEADPEDVPILEALRRLAPFLRRAAQLRDALGIEPRPRQQGPTN